MVNETNEDFGLGDRNFHPEEQRLNSKTMRNKNPSINNSDFTYKSGEKDLENYTRNDYDPYQDDLDDEDLDENVDEDLDDNGETSEDEDDDFDEKDKSDY